MSTQSVTTPPITPVGKVDRQVNDAKVRNWLFDGLTASSGAIDSISFLGLGKVFTAFMTGNVAFLGMGIAGNPVPRIVSVLASMAAFALGIYLATIITSSDEQKSGVSWSPLTTFVLGLSLLAHFGFVAIWFANSGHPSDSLFPIRLAVWALAMGLQSGAVRKLKVEASDAATGTLMVRAADVANWKKTRDERRRAGSSSSRCSSAPRPSVSLLSCRLRPVLPFVITIGSSRRRDSLT